MRGIVKRCNKKFQIKFYLEEIYDEAKFERVNICHNNINNVSLKISMKEILVKWTSSFCVALPFKNH